MPLLRIPDGWVQESRSASLVHKEAKSLLNPCADDKIMGIRIVHYTMGQPKPAGWFGSTEKKFRLIMRLELQYPRDHVLRVDRDLDDIITMRDAILKTNLSKKLAFVTFPVSFSELEGKEEFVNDVQTLLSFMDLLEEWLSNILRKSEFFRVNEVKEFVVMRDTDIDKLNIDLMASNGLGGAYTQEMKY